MAAMKLLILLLASPAIIAQRYRKSPDPNDEPFLPIYPVYPYSPKLIKRGTDRDAVTQLTAELYAPKVDAKDSYSASFGSGYQRDPYYPSYNPYPKSSSPAAYSSYYAATPYTYATTPYNVYGSYPAPYTPTTTPYSTSPYSSASYTSAPYTAAPYSAVSYPNYHYQPPYYYPNYYNQPPFPPPPPPPFGTDYPSPSKSSSDLETDARDKGKKSGKSQKAKDSEAGQESSGTRFVDGANSIGGTKDLDGQSSTYKTNQQNQQNQLEQVTDLKSIPLPLPTTTYRVISVAGQPVGPDYPLPAAYLKVQQLEQLMTQTLAKLLGQNPAQPAAGYPSYEVHQNALARPSEEAYVSQNSFAKNAQPLANVPGVLAKTGLGFPMNPGLLGKLNPVQASPAQVLRAPTSLIGASGYLDNAYAQKPYTRVTLDESSGAYAAPGKPGKQESGVQSAEYDGYDGSSSQSYDADVSSKQETSYENDRGQTPVSYQNQNYVTVQTPQAYSYQYTNYNPQRSSGQQQSQLFKTELDDVNFGAKQTGKG